MTHTNTDSVSSLDMNTDRLDLKKAQSTVIHKQLKKATEYALTQTITKWLLVEENEKLLSSKFICIRWSQTKGFIVLKKLNSNNNNNNKDDKDDKDKNSKNDTIYNKNTSDFILYVDLLGAMQSYIESHDNDINEWLKTNFAIKTQSKKKEDDEKKQQNDDDHHKIITLKSLYDILVTNWGENNIKVSDRKSVVGVVEFRIIASKKKLNSFYQSLDDLYHLLESENEEEKHTVSMDDWIATKPKCLKLKEQIGIDVNLTINPMDDALISGHIFLIYDEKDGSLFLTIQYEINNKKQVKFAKQFLNEFGLNDENSMVTEAINMQNIIELIQSLLKENKLNIKVSDEYKMHQEILFIVKDN